MGEAKIADAGCAPVTHCRQPRAAATTEKGAGVDKVGHPLPDAAVLKHALSFIGGGEYIWLAGVSRRWRVAYPGQGETSYSSCVASVQRMRLAVACGKVSYEKLIRAAAAAGALDVLEELRLEGRVRAPGRYIAHEASGRGHVHVLKWVRHHGFGWSIDPAAWACKHGQLAALEYLTGGGCPWSVFSCAAAAATAGHLAVLQFLDRAASCVTWDTRVVAAAAAAGHEHAVKWLLQAGSPCDDEEATAAAAAGGRITVLRHLQQFGCKLEAPALRAAVASEQLEAAAWLHLQAGVACDGENDVMRAAAEAGRLGSLAWLRRQRCGFGTALEGAAATNNIAVLDWLRGAGCPLTSAAMAAAAEAGHLDALEWLRRAGCPMDSAVAMAAASGRSTEAVRWLVESGCPMDARFFARCVAWGERAIVALLLDAGCPFDAESAAAAAAAGDLPMLMWLRTAGCPLDERVCSESQGHPDGAVLREWAHAAAGVCCKQASCGSDSSARRLPPRPQEASQPASP